MRQRWRNDASQKIEDLMRALTRLCLIAAVASSLTVSACGGGGKVVKVTTIKNGKVDGLRERDLAKLKEAKKARDTGLLGGIDPTVTDMLEGADPTVTNMIEATPARSQS